MVDTLLPRIILEALGRVSSNLDVSSDNYVSSAACGTMLTLFRRVYRGEKPDKFDSDKGYYLGSVEIGNPEYRNLKYEVGVGVSLDKLGQDVKICRLTLKGPLGETLMQYELNEGLEGVLNEYVWIDETKNLAVLQPIQPARRIQFVEALQYMLRRASESPAVASPTFYQKETLH